MTTVTGSGVACSQSQRVSSQNVALLDLQMILEQHQKFRRKHDALKKELKDIHARSRQQQQKLLEQRTGCSGSEPTPATTAICETRRADNAQLRRALKVTDLGQQETRLFLEERQRVVRAVENISRVYGTALVIQFVRREVAPFRPTFATP